MSDVAISARDVAKSYAITRSAPRHTTLGEAVSHTLKHGFRRAEMETFWALDGLSFEVRHGEVTGIIGRNGAGKSTLLKVLSQITAPTRGEIDIHGRVGSLLEVGTGFHPELTGRENIFLNGTILGMKRGEIEKKFDEIVAFAEVEQFLDTPVKRYSSGMYVRLAFAVAAHLDTDILIVDEVLAVGDMKFQQKCLGRMEEAASREGRTVLFVSHNLAILQQICNSAKLLDGGKLVDEGKPLDVIRRYREIVGDTTGGSAVSQHPRCEVRLRILDEAGAPVDAWRYGQALRVEVAITAKTPLWKPAVDLAFYDEKGNRLFALESDRMGLPPESVEGCWTAAFTIGNPGFTLSGITVDVGIREGAAQYLVLVPNAARLAVDHATVPDTASRSCILHPRASHAWRKEGTPE